MKNERRVYAPGKYCTLILGDGTKWYLETLPESVRIGKMGFILSTKLWEYQFPFYIRTAIEAWDTSKEVLEIVLNAAEGCNNSSELEQNLPEINTLLDAYVENNKDKAWSVAINKLGKYAFKKS